MKVLLQEWSTSEGFQRSISLNEEELSRIIEEVTKAKEGEPLGDAAWTTISDEHDISRTVKRSGTVFLANEYEYYEIMIFDD